MTTEQILGVSCIVMPLIWLIWWLLFDEDSIFDAGDDPWHDDVY